LLHLVFKKERKGKYNKWTYQSKQQEKYHIWLKLKIYKVWSKLPKCSKQSSHGKPNKTLDCGGQDQKMRSFCLFLPQIEEIF